MYDWFANISNVVLTCFAGIMSGMTVGFLSIDKLDLEIKLMIGTPEEKRQVSYLRLKLN